jgi:hypothetical protein
MYLIDVLNEIKNNLASFVLRLDETTTQTNLTQVLIYVSYGKYEGIN